MKISKIVKQIKKGDENGILKVIEIYSPLLKTIIKSKIKDEYLAEEVLNSVFLKIWNKIQFFDPTKGSFENWICAVANYESIDQLRKNFLKNDLNIEDNLIFDEKSPEYLVLEKELYNGIVDMINTLPEPDKSIFIDLFFEEESYELVSKKYGIKIANLYNLVSRRRKKLKTQFKEVEHE